MNQWQSWRNGAYRRTQALLVASLLALLMVACGGHGDNDGGVQHTATPVAPDTLHNLPGAPAATGDTVVDGLNWINFRRLQAGIPAVARNGVIDTAARGHSNYQQLNNLISHSQTAGQSGYTGATLRERLVAAGYALQAPYAIGEVIAATSGNNGAVMAEQLIAAIYHRFVMFEPRFTEAGAGVATRDNYSYFTCDLASNRGYGPGLGAGVTALYPYASQTGVPRNFFSDAEEPDPVPDRNEVGYPISLQGDLGSILSVQSFSVRPQGGAELPVRLLSHAGDATTPASAAAIVPLAVLSPGTVYDVSFSGTLDGAAITRNWSFTTE